MASADKARPRFLHLPEVLQMTGMGKSTIYRWMDKGIFPKQIQLGERSIVWDEQEITDWMSEKIKKS